jgi:hypothetical protein
LRVLRYFGHVIHAEGREKLFVEGKVCGARKRGRSPTRWTAAVRKATGRTFRDCVRLAQNRDQWRNIIHQAVEASHGHDTPIG